MKIDLNNITKEGVKAYFNELKRVYLKTKKNIEKYDNFLNKVSKMVLRENNYAFAVIDRDCLFERKTVKDLINKNGKYARNPEDIHFISFEDGVKYQKELNEMAEIFLPNHRNSIKMMYKILREYEINLIEFIRKVFPTALNRYGIDILTLTPSASNKKKILEAIVKLELNI